MVSGITAKVTLSCREIVFVITNEATILNFSMSVFVRSRSYLFDQLEILYLFKTNMNVDIFSCLSIFVEMQLGSSHEV